MNGVLCTLSAKRLALLQEDPEIFEELVESRHESEIPGLLDLGKTWDALDFLLSDRGRDELLGDAILARKGQKLRAKGAHGPPRVLAPARVRQISAALAKLPPDFLKTRYPSLQGKEIHGNYGQEKQLPQLEAVLRSVVDLYARAAIEGHSVMSAIV
ncbi:MAG: DUF1877 family protein [Hyalangium sp.]|uniref:DUF1877 family protein n=1 Tax=Hyalangium sp. TaxID=2028555 RepID=UPI00389A8381